MIFESFSMIWCRKEPENVDLSKFPQEFLDEMPVDIPQIGTENLIEENKFVISEEEINSYVCICGVKPENLQKWTDEV